MRNIEFRAKRLDNSEWVYGSLLLSEIDVNEIDVQAEIHERFANDFSIAKHKVDPKTVGQYVGLKDKNGKKIYEGDILKIEIEDEDSICGNIETFFGIVIYGEETLGHKKKFVTDYRASFTVFCKDFYKQEGLLGNVHQIIEVIGNTFDNPELINN